MLRRPIALLLSGSLLCASCIEKPRGAAQGGSQEAPQPAVPARIGHGDGAVPQVRLPRRLFPPRVATTPMPLGRSAALAPLPNGGALLLWSSSAPNVRPVSELALRSIAPDGTPGPIWAVRRTPGVVRGIDLAMHGDEGVMIWNAEIGMITSQISAERVRSDGTLLGSPFGIGTYRVIDPDLPDAGPQGTDRLGFPARVVATPSGFSIAVRGTLARCGTGMCPSVRVADVDEWDTITGRGGLQDRDPTAPITLLGSDRVPYALAVTFGGANGPARVETFGQGPLARLPFRDGALVAAWLQDGSARALVQHAGADSHGASSVELLGASPADAGATFVIDRFTVGCNDGIASVTFQGAAGTAMVRADQPGADAVFAWALDRNGSLAMVPTRGTNRPTAAPATPERDVSDVVWIRSGLLVARATQLELRRCQGVTLAPPVVVPWEMPATPDATNADAR